MGKVRALVSFTGSVSMRKGEVREISDLAISKDLIKAGYVEEVGGKKGAETEAEPQGKKVKGKK